MSKIIQYRIFRRFTDHSTRIDRFVFNGKEEALNHYLKVFNNQKDRLLNARLDGIDDTGEEVKVVLLAENDQIL